MKLYEFIGRVLGDAIAFEEKGGEKPNAVCISAGMYKKLDEDFRRTFGPVQMLRGVKTEPRLCGLRVYISDDLHGEEYFVGKVRTGTD